MTAPTSVEEYPAALPGEARAVLEELRTTSRAAAPGVTETVSYGMPIFKDQGRMLVSIAAFEDHRGLFPASQVVRDELGEEVAPHVTGKATIRFRANQPIPTALVTKVVKVRLAEAAARGDRWRGAGGPPRGRTTVYEPFSEDYARGGWTRGRHTAAAA